ncbi:hypothetical protein RHMOL_Rhmol06G0221500 [Rhododendron molle]|uniref:Uncharacterized protein n=1 Tax=Rhododendron molle TaxID=49168 RepID=A0ACC0NEW4_RHOML|nr:hypothetical protein RHMOL_Rhmol06G0221500 [Rhododendron molle]
MINENQLLSSFVGTAFFPLQSCMNHSCHPNARAFKREESKFEAFLVYENGSGGIFQQRGDELRLKLHRWRVKGGIVAALEGEGWWVIVSEMVADGEWRSGLDRDGQATIVALRSISKGEEVTISYIDEDLACEERQAMLADYGFRCRCQKCLEEEP